ncbi:MAG TPA: energy transducer TonB [Puia sp.]|jgi:protein TonB|nr:energy transducer TonB [Puia sp.]
MKIILTLVFAFCFCSTHAQTDTIKTDTSEIVIYKNPEVPATYLGGPSAWFPYLSKNLRYPEEALNHNHVQGAVVTRFIVDSIGHSHHFVSVSGPEELREEAIRVIKNVEIWVPATNAGKTVNSWKEQEIRFKLVN